MKRYRDESGHLTLSLDEIARRTAAESRNYYRDGSSYLHQGRLYTLHLFADLDAHGNSVEMALFESADGYRIFCDPDRLGTFLPDVASEGNEIVRV